MPNGSAGQVIKVEPSDKIFPKNIHTEVTSITELRIIYFFQQIYSSLILLNLYKSFKIKLMLKFGFNFTLKVLCVHYCQLNIV